MADNIKISELVELTSGSLGDATIFPIVDGGSTRKATLSTLQSYLTDDLATDIELSNQISTVNSTITALTTTEITEGTNEYYTNAKVDARINSNGAITSSVGVDLTATTNYISGIKSRLNTENVVSSSQQISASAAASGFGAGGGGVVLPSGTVSSSAQTIENLGGSDIVSSSQQISASAAASGFGAGGGGGGGSSDYISTVSVNNSTLTFTGVGSGFNGTINLAADGSDGANLLTTGDAGNFVGTGDYTTDSASFANRVGGGGSVPSGTVSSSAQTIKHINSINVVSSSNQIDGAQIDLSSLTTDDVGQGVTNKYYANSLVLPYLNQLQVVSGSGGGGGGFSISGTNIISSSEQITDLTFVLQSTLDFSASALQASIDAIPAGVNLSDVNTYTALQKFTQGLVVTGSMLLTGGSYSGSGAQLSNIPASAVVGLSSTTQLVDGDNNVTVDNVQGITSTVGTGDFNVKLDAGSNLIITGGHAIAQSGSWFSGSGQGLTGIPGSAIEGGVDGQKIFSGSFSASIESTLVGSDLVGSLRVNVPAVFDSTISASGEITAQSISVGSSGVPTIYSANNLNLSSSGTVVVTDSPLRLNPLTNTTTSSFILSPGDITFNSTSNDFYGYKIVDTTGSWYSLTEGTVSEVSWGVLVGIPPGLVSASSQISSLGGGLISSSGQILPISASSGTIYYEDTLDNMSGSSDFVYTAGTRTLNVNKVIANELVYNTSLTGAGNDTGSYGRVETDALIINSAIEFPQSDGTPNQVLKTDGSGNLGFATFNTLLGADSSLTSTGTFTMGTGSVNSDLVVKGTLQLGSPIHSTINNQTAIIDSSNISFQSSGSMLLSSSMHVTIDDVLTLSPRTTTPSNPPSGSIISSGSGITIKPYFWNGNVWTALY